MGTDLLDLRPVLELLVILAFRHLEGSLTVDVGSAMVEER